MILLDKKSLINYELRGEEKGKIRESPHRMTGASSVKPLHLVLVLPLVYTIVRLPSSDSNHLFHAQYRHNTLSNSFLVLQVLDFRNLYNMA